MNKDREYGFTLIELMVAVVILAILAAIAIPSYMGIQKRSARSEAKANLEAIALALEGYMAENNHYGNGVFAYTCGPNCPGTSFNHPGPIGTVANLGNNLMYWYKITATTAPPAPAFAVSAIPMPGGRMSGDITIWLRSDGIKGPTGAGW